jgi:hypothetical protein
MVLGTPWSPQLRLIAFFTMRPSSRSMGRTIDFASMPISCRKKSGRKVSSSRRRSSQLSNVVADRPKMELLIKTTADHFARQTGEFYFAIMWEISCAIDCTKRIGSLSGMVGGASASERRRVMSIWLPLDGELLNVLHDQLPRRPTRSIQIDLSS